MTDPTEIYQQQRENEGLCAWFKEHCRMAVGQCPAAEGHWYMDKDGDTRCAVCGMRGT